MSSLLPQRIPRRLLILCALCALIGFVILSVTPRLRAQQSSGPRAIVRHGFALNGRIEGSVQQLTGEATTFNGNAALTGDLLVPGTPTIIKNGQPNFGGVVQGSGSAQPSNYQVILNGNAQLGRLITRTDTTALLNVPAPPNPTGTRDVVLNSSGQNPGDFATVRDLTLNGNVGAVAVPPGTYRRFTGNGNSTFVFGVAGSSQPVVYNLNALTLNGGSRLEVVGPVVLTTATAITLNASMGSSAHPLWLTLNVASGGVTLNGGSALYGSVNAPAGTVIINGNSSLTGSLACDGLNMNGNALLRLLQVDITPPSVNIVQPADGALLNTTSVAVSGTYSDQSATTITVNGVAATISGNNFNATVPLQEGANALQLIATDAAGNRTQATRIVKRDTLAPALTIQQPAEGAITRAPQVILSGTFNDATATSITVNGSAAAISGNSFSATVPVNEGANQLQVVATDAAGNRSELTRTIVGDTIAPVITLAQPLDGESTNQTQLLLAGTFDEAAVTTILVNNMPAEISGNSFTAVVPLPSDGAHSLTVRATDAAGNESVITLSVTRDTVAPVLTVTAPANGIIRDDGVVDVTGSATDALPVTVTANRMPLDVGANGLFSGRALLAEGDVQLTVAATDAAGNVTEQTRSLVVDQTPPVIDNIQPDEDALVDSPATISAKVTDATAVTVTINGVAATAGTDHLYSAANVALAEGENEITVRAVDAAGNETSAVSILVARDNTPPTAPTLFPLITPTRLTFQTVEGRVESGAQVTISGGVQPVTVNAAYGSGLFAANVDLAVGANILTITARDKEGNASQPVQISITSDPSIALPGPGQAARINISTGNAQKGLIETELPRPLIAIVTDQGGNPVPNVAVSFAVLEGGGQLVGGGGSVLTVSTDADGRASARYSCGALTGPQEIRASFASNTGTPAIFLEEALEATPGAATSVSGLVLDQNLRALPNALVRLGGQETRTGADGRFALQNVAAGPHQLLELIGRDQIQLPGRWPNISYDFDVLPGIDNSLGRPLFLPKVNGGVALPLDASSTVTQDTSYDLPVVGGEPPIRVTARAGTHVSFPPDVTDKRLSVTRIATDRVPMALEDGRATNLYISVQPSGAIFNQPLEISFPNLDHLAANTETLLMSFDHDAGRYIKVGTGHVSNDGRRIVSDPGSGIRVGAWHAFPPPQPQDDASADAFIQIENNSAFEDKYIEHDDSWVEVTRAVLMTAARPSLALAPVLNYRGTLSLPANTVKLSKVNSILQVRTPKITDLTWEKINSTVESLKTDSERIFPDRETLGTTGNLRIIRVRATVEPKRAGIKVYFKSFDMDDPSSDAAALDSTGPDGNDNRGRPRKGRLSNSFALTDKDGVATTQLTVSPYPGDNYRVAASAKRGYLSGVTVNGTNLVYANNVALPNDDAKRTSLLTVWRRLHVEVDSMVGPRGVPVNGHISSVSGAGKRATEVVVNQKLDDGSPKLDNPGATFMDGGRFQGGRIIIGVGADAKPTERLEGNGKYFLRKRSGFDIPFRLSKGGEQDVTGNVVALGGFTVTLNVTGGTLTDKFTGGVIEIAGVAVDVKSIKVIDKTITLDRFPNIPFELRDDDSTVLPVLPNTTQLEDLFAPAYILPVVDGGGRAGNIKQNVPFKLNVDNNFDDISSALMLPGAMESNRNRQDDFWVAYLLQAYQGSTYSDDDPMDIRGDVDSDFESATGGITTELNGKGSLIYLEELNDSINAFTPIVIPRVSVHEIGHQFGLDDCDKAGAGVCSEPDLMGTGEYDAGAKFSEVELNIIRSRIHSPGRRPQ